MCLEWLVFRLWPDGPGQSSTCLQEGGNNDSPCGTFGSTHGRVVAGATAGAPGLPTSDGRLLSFFLSLFTLSTHLCVVRLVFLGLLRRPFFRGSRGHYLLDFLRRRLLKGTPPLNEPAPPFPHREHR